MAFRKKEKYDVCRVCHKTIYYAQKKEALKNDDGNPIAHTSCPHNLLKKIGVKSPKQFSSLAEIDIFLKKEAEERSSRINNKITVVDTIKILEEFVDIHLIYCMLHNKSCNLEEYKKRCVTSLFRKREMVPSAFQS